MDIKRNELQETELGLVSLSVDVNGNLIYTRGQIDPDDLSEIIDDETMIVTLRIFLRHFDWLEREIKEYINE